MNTRIQEVLDRVDALSVRERLIVLLTALAVIYAIWDLLAYRPVAQAHSFVQTELSSVEQKIAAMEQEERLLLQNLKADPDRELKAHLQDLQKRMTVLDDNLSELSVGLVPADKLATILQEVLSETGSLQLHSVRTLPVKELQLKVKTDVDAANAGVFKHSVAITVKGSYFEFLNYLKSLEAMNWRFYWDELRYSQEDYPNGLFEIQVYTLSTEEGLFGV